jgi:PAS domain S-box-containing protein
MLELQASAGRYTHLNGPHGRVPVGKFKIGLIAEERKPHLTNQVVGDPRVGDQEWAKREGMVAFAGYPLLVEDRLVGVVAMFACHTLTDTTLQALASISNNIAVGIERKRAEEALRASQQVIEGIINAIPVRVFWKDKNLVYLGCNAVFARDAGFADPKDIIGKDDYQMGWRDQADLYCGDDRQVIESGCPKLFIEEPQTTPEGNSITLLSSKLPLRNSKGEISGILGTYTDITERKQAEAALRSSEERFRIAAETANDVIYEWDLKQSLEWLGKIDEMLGYEPGEFPRTLKGWAASVHPEDLERTMAAIQAHLEERVPFAIEYRVRRKDGVYRWWSARGAVARTPDGKPARWIGSITDITERKQAEGRLTQERDLSEAILNNMPGLFYLITEKGRFLRWNRQLETVSGYSGEEIARMHPLDILSAEHKGLVAEQILQVFKTGRSTAEADFLTKQGERLPFYFTGGTVIVDGQPCLAGTGIDITERKRLEAQLSQSQKMETVGKLAGGIAHEFNSILTAIIGQSELLLGDLAAGSPLAKNATEIRQAAERAATLTRQLLAYGRKQRLQPEILDLNSVLAGMASTLGHLLGQGADVRIVPGGGLKAVKADAGQIEQVIMNMAMNAADAMPNGGNLTLETANVTLDQEYVSHSPELKAGEYVMLAITDTGTGMSEEAKARVFEPFFSTKGVGQGTGLGLSTCYGIIKQSGGHISFYSEPGQGTTFKIYLPQVEPQTKIPIQRLDSPDLPRGTETILLVEDDPALREMAATLLRRLGYTVLAVANGIEALSLKQQRDNGHIDLLFTDVVMPKMSGKDLSDRVLAAHPETKVLSTSAYAETAIVHQGVLDPGISFLQKPFTPAALASKVRELLDA